MKMDDLGGETHYFRKHPYILFVLGCPRKMDSYHNSKWVLNLLMKKAYIGVRTHL